MYNYNHLTVAKKQKGLTLIELMVATTLGILVILGVTQSLLAMSQSSRVSARYAELHKNANLGLSYVAFRMRNALSTPCESYNRIGSSNLTVQPLADSAQTPITNAHQTQISNLIRGFGVDVLSEQVSRDFDGDGTPSDYTTDRVRLISIEDRLLANSRVTHKSKDVTVNGEFVSTSGSDMLYAITDCEKMDIFRADRSSLPLSGGGNGTRLTFMDNTNIITAYDPDDLSIISPLDVAEIYVNDEGNLIDKTLFQAPGGALIDNVDLIRVLFGVDSNGDGTTDRYITAPQLSGLPSNSNSIMSADIYMLIRVDKTNPSYPKDMTVKLPITDTPITGALPQMETITLADRIQRKVFMRSVVFRNNAMTL